MRKREPEHFGADGFALPSSKRILPLNGKKSGGREREHAKVKTLGKTSFMIDKETLDLRYVEQLVDSEQTTALAYMLRYAKEHYAGSRLTLTQLIGQLNALMEKQGLGAVCDSSYVPVSLAMPRIQEIFACFNRY